MSRIYHIIWSFRTHVPQVASEEASSGRKSLESTHDKRQNSSSHAAPFALKIMGVAIASLCLSAPAWAVTGTDGTGASSSNVTQGDSNNIALGGGNVGNGSDCNGSEV